MRILVTGEAGFIGFHVANRLLAEGHEVVGLDSVNQYYDVRLKEARLALLQKHRSFEFVRAALADPEAMNQLFDRSEFERVIHLAAQAGVRYSLERPDAYITSNILGFLQVLEECRYRKVPHLVYASSSSVYGANTQMPFSVHRGADHPLSMYGATKRSNELMAHSYSYLFALPTPDEQWSSDRPDPSSSSAPFRLYNVGNQETVELHEVIELLEETLGKKARSEERR